MKNLPSIVPRDANLLDLLDRPLQVRTFSPPVVGMSQFDVEAVRTQADTLLRLERMRFDTSETLSLVSSTSMAMSKVLDMYRDYPMPSYMRFEAKTKLSGLFGKSCTMTVEVFSRRDYFCRGPAR